MSIKKNICNFILNLYYKINPPLISWQGDYANWDIALKRCSGYENEIILNKVIESTNLVIAGKAAFERDGIAFDKSIINPLLLTSLFYIKNKRESSKKLNIMDFGGSLGSIYFQHKHYLDLLKPFKWIIIEQEHYVNYGKNNLETNELVFHANYNELIKNNKLDVAIFSSVLQYLENPYLILNEIMQINVPYILIDLTSIVEGLKKKEIITIQKIRKEMYGKFVSYPCRIFDKKNLLSIFNQNYEIILEQNSYLSGSWYKKRIDYSFYLLKKKL